MYFEPSDIATGREALEEFLVPERISVNAMVQNKIQTMIRSPQYQERPEARAALKDLSDWLEIVLSRDVEELGKLLKRTYDLPIRRRSEVYRMSLEKHQSHDFPRGEFARALTPPKTFKEKKGAIKN